MTHPAGLRVEVLVRHLSYGLFVVLAATFTTFPANSAERGVNGTPSIAEKNLDRAAVITAEKAASLSIQPFKRLVFHYNSNMPEGYQIMVRLQAEILRKEGYHVVALPGCPDDGVKIYIAGKTAEKLLFSRDQIVKQFPRNYGAGYYQKIIGQPQSDSIDVAD